MASPTMDTLEKRLAAVEAALGAQVELRDNFAAHLLSARNLLQVVRDPAARAALAESAYEFADAMMLARNKAR